MAYLSRWIFIFFLFSCATTPERTPDYERDFKATAYEYNINASPQINSRIFRSRIRIMEQGQVKVLTIKNFVKNKGKPDSTVKVAISLTSAGSVIYNDKMQVVAEYPKGKIINENLLVFEQKSGVRNIIGRWFIDDDFMMSDFTMTGENGLVLLKEVVIYRAKNPTRKPKKK